MPISWLYSPLRSTDTVPPVTVQLSSLVSVGTGQIKSDLVQPPRSSSMMYCACCCRPRSWAVISAQGIEMPVTASPPPLLLFFSLRSARPYSRRYGDGSAALCPASCSGAPA